MRFPVLAGTVVASCALSLIALVVSAQPPTGGPAAGAPVGGPAAGAPTGEPVGGPAGSAKQVVYSPADLARRERVVARIGDESITVGEVEDAVNAQSPFLRVRYRDPERLREFVQNMIRFELLAREANRRDLQDLPDVARAVKQQAVQQLMRRDFDEQITPESVPAEEVRAYYDGHPDEFHRPPVVRASHILVDTREKALDLIKQARASDMREFRRLARQHSEDLETKLRGGDLRFFKQDGRMVGSPDRPVNPAIVTAAFALRENGDVAPEPIPIDDKFSVVMRTARRDEENRTYEQSEQGIRLRIWRDRRRRAVEDFVRQLHARLRPEIFRDRLSWIVLDPPGPDDFQGGRRDEVDPLGLDEPPQPGEGANEGEEEAAPPPEEEGAEPSHGPLPG